MCCRFTVVLADLILHTPMTRVDVGRTGIYHTCYLCGSFRWTSILPIPLYFTGTGRKNVDGGLFFWHLLDGRYLKLGGSVAVSVTRPHCSEFL